MTSATRLSCLAPTLDAATGDVTEHPLGERLATRKTAPRFPRTPRRATTSLSDAELLQLVVDPPGRKGNDGRFAETLLMTAGGVGGLAGFIRARPGGALGITASQAYRLDAMLELGRRASRAQVRGSRITCRDDVQRWAASRLSDLEHEEVWILVLDGTNRLRAEYCVGRGGLHGCGLLPADILRPAVRSAATALILVHNHPSDDPTPSQEDVVMTRELVYGCRILGLALLDHVVVSRSGSRSLAELGVIHSLEGKLASSGGYTDPPPG